MKQNWKKNTAIFMASQGISIFGSTLVQHAITWYITLTTKSGVYATLSIVFGILPTFLLSPLGGVWADRYNRKKLIVWADAGIAVCTFALAMFFIAGFESIWLVLVASTIRAVGSGIQNPCVNAMLPDIVPGDQLTKINGLNSSLQSLITLISPMLAGVLMSVAPIQVIFFIDVVTAAAAIFVMALFFKLPHKPKEQIDKDYFADLKKGFRYIGQHAYLRSLFVFYAAIMLMATPVMLLSPLQVARNYGDAVWQLTTIELTFSIGMVIGGLVIAAWGGFRNRAHSISVTCAILGILTACFGFRMPFWLYATLMGLMGLSMPLLNTPAVVMLQQRVHPEYIGRIFGVITMVSTGIMPVAMMLYGPLADTIPIEYIMLATGILLALTMLLVILNKPLLEAGKPLTPEELAALEAPGAAAQSNSADSV